MEKYENVLGYTIYLTFDEKEIEPEKHVLILPFYQGKLVFTKHKQRGIELPGGKIEEGETPLAAAVREVYEEIGASLSEIKRIGQYIIECPPERIVKTIYVATIEKIVDIPFSTDTDGPIWFEEIPTDVQNDPNFSIFMKDEVYPRTLKQLGLIS